MTLIVELMPHHRNPNPQNKNLPPISEYRYLLVTRREALSLNFPESMAFAHIISAFKEDEALRFFVRTNVKSRNRIPGMEDEFAWCSAMGHTLESALAYAEARIRDSNVVVEPLRGIRTEEMIHNRNTIRCISL